MNKMTKCMLHTLTRFSCRLIVNIKVDLRSYLWMHPLSMSFSTQARESSCHLKQTLTF